LGVALIPFVVGVLVAAVVAAFGKVTRFQEDRGFYPTVLIVIASYYVLFAVLGGSSYALFWELVVTFGFSAIAVFPSSRGPLLVGIGITAHGLFDLVHHVIIQNPGVPSWWPIFCASVDVPLGVWVISLPFSRNKPLKGTAG
jgi:hypothetical protein